MIIMIAVGVLALAIGSLASIALLHYFRVKPLKKKLRALQKSSKMEQQLLLHMLLHQVDNDSTAWKKDRKGNIISPLQNGRKGS